MSYRILLVEPDSADGLRAAQVLAPAGHRVAWVDTFADAVSLSESDPPDLLISALRLGAYNGLHLLMHVRAQAPQLPVVIACESSDFTPDIERFGACHVPKPIAVSSLASVVGQLLADCTPQDPRSTRIWPRKPTELSATVQDANARVVELSYGGVRMSLDRPIDGAPTPMQIKLPSLGVSVEAVPRWVKPSDDGASWWCGAEVALPTPAAARTWRRVVASLN